MKYTITIEETCTKDFEIEAGNVEEAYNLAVRKYKAGELVLEPGECQFKQIFITGSNEEAT